MVELIVVMVLIGIIGTIAASRFFDRSGFDAAAWTDQVRAILRYGQKVAVAQNHPVFVLLTSDRVALCLDPAPACVRASQVLAPGGANSASEPTLAACGSDSWMCEARPEGLAMTVPAAAIRFDGLGRAQAGNIDAEGRFAPTAAAGRFALAVNAGEETHALGVEAETGYVD